MTKKLYYEDAYATEFDAVVVSCEGNQVVLDQTLFFPEEGGQSSNKGVLGGANVLDVQIKNDIITHTLDKPLEVGAAVHGEIDWKHRFSNMQQHSGEHIFSGTVNRLYGYNNVGFHLSDNIVTMDFNGVLTEEEVASVEYLVNNHLADFETAWRMCSTIPAALCGINLPRPACGEEASFVMAEFSNGKLQINKTVFCGKEYVKGALL